MIIATQHPVRSLFIVLVTTLAISFAFFGCAEADSGRQEVKSASTEPTVASLTSSDEVQLMGTPVQNHGVLHVEGTQLMDSYGRPVQLHGMSTHGLAWYPSFVNPDAFATLRDDWNANCIRLALYPYEWGGYANGGDQQALKDLVVNGVNWANDLGMYAIIDWHVLNEQSPTVYQDQAIAFFSEMASRFRDYPNVLYEICNEPNGWGTWDQIKSYANAVIPVIRSNDPDAVIIVGTPTWSQDVHVASADRLGYSNIMYALHFYAATHTDWLRSRAETALQEGLPIFVSEFGICDASGNGSIDYGQAAQWMDLINRYNLSYCNWSLANKNETCCAIRDWCTKVSWWSPEELSDSGNWIRNQLRSEGADTPPVAAVAPFSDVAGHWADTAGIIKAVSDRGLMSGSRDGITGQMVFRPDAPVTRAEVVTILRNHAISIGRVSTQSGNGSNRTPFDDNSPDMYYTEPVNWAWENGILAGNGVSAMVSDNITRQDLALMIKKYVCNYLGYDNSGAQPDAYASCPDAHEVSEYAQSGVGWCFTHGIMSGDDQRRIHPHSTATRAEIASMILKTSDLVLQ